MAERLQTPITDLYLLPYYEYAMYFKIDEDEAKEKLESNSSMHFQKKWEIPSDFKKAEFPNKLNLPDSFK